MDIEENDFKKLEKSIKENNLKYVLKSKSFSINTAMIKNAVRKKSSNSKEQKELSNIIKKKSQEKKINLQKAKDANCLLYCKQICWNIVKCFCSCFMDYKPSENHIK